MSRIGKIPVVIPQGVKVAVVGDLLKVDGPKGKLSQKINPGVNISVNDGKIVFTRPAENSESRTVQGLIRSLVSNMVDGVTKGYERKLEISGVGYRAEVQGDSLVMSLGFSHPVKYQLPAGVKAEVEKQTMITLSGADKQVIGQAAANIRGFKPPEPYKGKGIKYQGEKILRKAGKAGKAGK
ncbi:MAG: 50S ribosomal protein L6 [Deltaproteobacteria bacterium]|nr:50S ribosomal protein L6 [Deltaproteobacteria bacterium]MBM2837966.1 ribosomal protein [Deltaproteobacteria bacterium]